MVKDLRHTKDIKDLQQPGKVAYLIIEGCLTFNRKNMRGRAAFTGRNKIKGGLYDLEANKQGRCTFVEGHVCLSPAFATELLKAGQMHWVDESGEKVDNATIINLLKETVIKSDSTQVRRGGGKVARKMRFSVTVPNADTDENARQLKRWFENEWEDYESKRGDIKMVDTKTLYRAPKNNAGGVAKASRAASEVEESEFNGWSLSSRTLSFGTPEWSV